MNPEKVCIGLRFIEGQPNLVALSHNVTVLACRAIGIEIFDNTGSPRRLVAPYTRIHEYSPQLFSAFGEVSVENVRFAFEDQWLCDADRVELQRIVKAQGTRDEAGFASSVWGDIRSETGWDGIDLFAPGMLYGRPDVISPSGIGGTESRQAGVRHVLIREDRLPLPVVGLRLPSNLSLSLCHLHPDGQTTVADSLDVDSETPLIDDRFGFGSLGVANVEGGVSLGFCYPGCEGDITYRGDTCPGGQLRRWRLRYHPVRDGFSHSYRVVFRITEEQSLTTLVRSTWRRAWQAFKPQLQRQDLSVARSSLVTLLTETIQTVNGKTGIPLFWNAVTGHLLLEHHSGRNQLMGFVGRNTDAAYQLLREAARGHARANELKEKATAIINDFVQLRMNPPEAEGFDHGQPVTHSYLGLKDILYLRSLTEGALSVLKTYWFEKDLGRTHPAWKEWSLSFGRWLLTRQRTDGSFARGFHAGSGEEANPASLSSYTAIEFLAQLGQEADDEPFMLAAIRCGDFVWESGQKVGRFVGGTIDNPDVADKEAATISLKAYLALFEATRDNKWLDRAILAGDIAETWIYGWNIPMPVDADESILHWKRGVSTVGLQLISTGHSLVDQYMAVDVGSFRKLHRYTGDIHYGEIADILLHNTKTMLALPGRAFDLAGPGWQQEHWSLAPRRGIGLHRLWLPWIAVNHLQGLTDHEDLTPNVFD